MTQRPDTQLSTGLPAARARGDARCTQDHLAGIAAISAAPPTGPGLTPRSTRELTVTGTTGGRPDLMLLERVLAALQDTRGTAPVAEDCPPQPEPGQPPRFLAAVTRLRRLLAACPDVEITHTQDPWVWTAVIAPARQGGEASLVSGASLAGLADALHAEVTRWAGAEAALQTLRATWGDRYQIWFDGQWRYRRHDGRSGEISAPSPGALHRLIADDYTYLPGRPG